MSIWTTSHDANYENYQSGLLINLLSGSVPGDLVPFPAANSTVKKPNKIVVQAHPNNTGPILVGKDPTLADDGSNGGFYLAPGEMQVLPDNNVANWRARGTGAGGQQMLYTYLSGAN